MKRLIFVFLFLSTVLTVQAASIEEAANIARQLGGSQELARNVQLRFQVLAHRMKAFQGKDAQELLNFFSDTRVMVWNRPVSQELDRTMRGLEAQMAELARQKGLTLQMEPVGHAPRRESRLLSSERVTLNGVVNLCQRTEEKASAALMKVNSAELLFLRDNLTRFREDLSDGKVSSLNVRSVLGARARFLVSDAASVDGELTQQLIVFAEVLRSLFTPQALRGARGGELTIE
jgi:hypothetical protein